MKGWGNVEESLWPINGNEWPPKEPPEIDQKAKANRIFAYHRASTIDECRILLASEMPVIIALEIDDSWSNPPKGIIPIPDKDQFITGSHSVCLYGYEDYLKRFLILNSWGLTWGDNGFGYLPYEYFPERFLEGWTFLRPLYLHPPIDKISKIKVTTWGTKDSFGNMLHGVEINDVNEDEMIGWGFAIERNNVLELEELFVRPNWREKGFASKIAKEFITLSDSLRKKLKVWIPHPDVVDSNLKGLHAILDSLNITYSSSPVRWASGVGISGN